MSDPTSNVWQKLLLVSCCWMVFLISSSEAESCADTATHVQPFRFKYISSPKFPKKFPAQTQCNWIIIAPPRYRVKIVFTKFYLMDGTSERLCVTQSVEMHDSFSGMSDGPYCGNSFPPVLRSTGRMVRVRLQSDALGLRSFYSGFQIKVKATLEPSSPRVRDPEGRWKMFGAVGQDVTTPPPVRSPTRASHEVDKNNNHEIDARNNAVNSQRNLKRLESPAGQDVPGHLPVNPARFSPAGSPGRAPPPSRFQKRVKPKTKPKKIATTRRPMTLHTPPRTRRLRTDVDDEEESGFPVGAIVAIAIGALLILLVVWIVFSRRRHRKKVNEKQPLPHATAMANAHNGAHHPPAFLAPSRPGRMQQLPMASPDSTATQSSKNRPERSENRTVPTLPASRTSNDAR